MRPFLVPLLPCRAIDPVLDFYTAMGFEVTYRQKAPNVYAAIRYGRDINLHFYVIKDLAPERNHGTCLVILDDPRKLHTAFTDNYRNARGAVPLTGFPRIPRWRAGQTRFNVADPAGNIIRFISRSENEGSDWVKAPEESSSPLAKVLVTALKLRDGKGDERMAAATLDRALKTEAKTEHPAPVRDRARVLALRAELASVLGEAERLAELKAGFAALPLTREDRSVLKDVLTEMKRL